jgi:natural product biosynthesis luciferase-like monooxygenase protein
MLFGLMFFASNEDSLRGDKYRVLIESARFADRHGFASVWLPERHFTPLGGAYPNPAVLHAALARETRSIALRAGSVVLPLHDPIRIAEEWSVVDNLSGGRVGISFAAGWNPDDFAFFPERYPDRRDEMFRGIETVRALWRGQPVAVRSGSGKPVEVRIYPTPVQRELPVWCTAAGSPETFVRAGEIGAGLLTHLLDQGVEDLAGKIALYRAARARRGHGPGQVAVMLHTFVGESLPQVREAVRGPYCEYLKSNAPLLQSLARSRGHDFDVTALSAADLDQLAGFLFERFATARGLIGTPEVCLDLLRELAAAGVDEVACLLDFGPSTELILEHLPFLARLRDAWEAAESRPAAAWPDRLAAVRAACGEEIAGAEVYARLRHHGFEGYEIGGEDRVIERLWRRDGEALARLALPPSWLAVSAAGALPPALLETCFQVLAATVPGVEGTEGMPLLAVGLGRLQVHRRPGAEVWLHALLHPGGAEGTSFTGDVQLLDDRGLAAEALGVRLASPRSARPVDAPPQWLYEVVWKEAPAAFGERPAEPAPAAWLILADAGGVGLRLAERLGEGGATCRVWAGEGAGPGLRAWLQGELAHAAGIVHLASLDAEAGLDRGLAGALDLIQALAGLEEEPPPVWWVTRGAQGPGAETVHPGQAPLWGLGQAAAAEHPRLRACMVDLDPGWSPGEAAGQLLLSLRDPARREWIALRREGRRVARLRRAAALPAASPVRFRRDATYLITGGLGGLGAAVAVWMAERGAGRLLLTRRGAVTGRDHSLLERLRGLGTEAVGLQADAACAGRMSAVLADSAAAGPPLRGVFHLAGGLDDVPLARSDGERFARAGAAKIEGAWLLHRLTRELPIEHFVLFSSAAALLCPPGQGAYAAANSFLDALARHRRGAGLPALSIGWGPWSGIGFAGTPYGRHAHAALARHGIAAIPPERGLALLDLLLQQEKPHLVAAAIDWRLAARTAAVRLPLVAELLPEELPESEEAPASPLRDALLGSAPARRREILLATLERELGAVLKLPAETRLDPEQGFFDLGMDSLMTLELRDRLQACCGCPLPSTLAFQYSSLGALAGRLEEILLGQDSPARGGEEVRATPPPSVDDVRQLSESELAALIDNELDALAR